MGIYWESFGQQTGSPYGDDFGSLDVFVRLTGGMRSSYNLSLPGNSVGG